MADPPHVRLCSEVENFGFFDAGAFLVAIGEEIDKTKWAVAHLTEC